MQDTPVGSGPKGGFLIGVFENFVRPSIAGKEEVIGAFRFIKGIVVAIDLIGGDEDGNFIFGFKIALDDETQ